MAKAVGVDIWADLLLSYAATPKGSKRDAFGLELLPYIKPKLKAMEVSGILTTNHTFTIGGPDG
jgi:hypothetical protein